MLGTPYTVMDKTKVCTHPPYGLLINYSTIIMQIKKLSCDKFNEGNVLCARSVSNKGTQARLGSMLCLPSRNYIQ